MESFRTLVVMSFNRSKKRKYSEQDLEAERTLYSAFSTAANAVSQLYTQAVQQQRRATAQATRATLVSWGHCTLLKASRQGTRTALAEGF